MKRSEMIQRLIWYMPTESGMANKHDMESLLNYIENQGMLPPNANEFDMAIKNPKTDEWVITFKNKIRTSITPFHQWEPE